MNLLLSTPFSTTHPQSIVVEPQQRFFLSENHWLLMFMVFDKEFVNTLEDNIQERGAMDKSAVIVLKRRIAIASRRFCVSYASVLGLGSLIMKTRSLQRIDMVQSKLQPIA
jgi:hypothetical protein